MYSHLAEHSFIIRVGFSFPTSNSIISGRDNIIRVPEYSSISPDLSWMGISPGLCPRPYYISTPASGDSWGGTKAENSGLGSAGQRVTHWSPGEPGALGDFVRAP
jgi:hypothetical protein